MEGHEMNLNASVVANNLGRIYKGPLLLPGEVWLRRREGKSSMAAFTRIAIGQDHPFVKMNGGTVPGFLLLHYAKQLGMLILEHSQGASFQDDPGMPMVRVKQGCMEEPGVLSLEVVPVVVFPTQCEFFSVACRENRGVTSCWQFVLEF